MLFKYAPPIAVIDSGIGGLKLCKKIQQHFKNENIIYFADDDYMPYGNKTVKQLNNRLKFIIDYLKTTFHIKMAVLACNTISAIFLKSKSKFDIPIFVVSPTEFNLPIISTKMTAKLYKTSNCLPIPKLASEIENNFFDSKKLTKYLKFIGKIYHFDKYNQLVLGCTHYELISKYFKEIFPHITFLSPTEKTLKEIIKSNILSNFQPKIKGTTYLMCSSQKQSYIQKLNLIFNEYL